MPETKKKNHVDLTNGVLLPTVRQATYSQASYLQPGKQRIVVKQAGTPRRSSQPAKQRKRWFWSGASSTTMRLMSARDMGSLSSRSRAHVCTLGMSDKQININLILGPYKKTTNKTNKQRKRIWRAGRWSVGSGQRFGSESRWFQVHSSDRDPIQAKNELTRSQNKKS